MDGIKMRAHHHRKKRREFLTEAMMKVVEVPAAGKEDRMMERATAGSPCRRFGWVLCLMKEDCQEEDASRRGLSRCACS